MTIEAGFFGNGIRVNSEQISDAKIQEVYDQFREKIKPLSQGLHAVDDKIKILVLEDGSGFLKSSDHEKSSMPKQFIYLDPKIRSYFAITSPINWDPNITILKALIITKVDPDP